MTSVTVHPKAALNYHVQSYKGNQTGDRTAYCDIYYLATLERMQGRTFVVMEETATHVKVEFGDGEAVIRKADLVS